MRVCNTKERILNESIRLFVKKGYDAITASDISNAVKIKAPSLYKHYPGKSAIYESILNRS